MSYYHLAQVCKNGHLINSTADTDTSFNKNTVQIVELKPLQTVQIAASPSTASVKSTALFLLVIQQKLINIAITVALHILGLKTLYYQ